MRNCEKCGLALGVGLCLFCLGAGGTYEFRQPSDIACLRARNDLGPSPMCDDRTLPHSRTGWVTSVAASSSTSVTNSGVIFPFTQPTVVAYSGRDAEDAAETPRPAFGASVTGPNAGSFAGIGERNYTLIHPNADERLILIRRSTGRDEEA